MRFGWVKRSIIKLVAALTILSLPLAAVADQFDGPIADLQASINANQAQVNSLRAQSDSLQRQLELLNAQIAQLQNELALTQERYDQTTARIAQAEAELAAKHQILAENIRIIYHQSQISPLEQLMGSNSISDFLDAQQYLNDVEKRIQSTLDSITATKKQLEAEKQDLTNLLAKQQSLKIGLDSQRNQSYRLMAQTQGQEANYQALVAQNQRALAAVVAARAAAVHSGQLRVTSGGCGGYPAMWCNASQDSMVDDWSYYNRECVSYVAWKRWSLGMRPQPDHWGNASDWAAYVDHRSNPRSGDIAVWGAYANDYVGGYGHVAYVQSVDGGGITISQFNFDVGDGWGRYSTMYVQYGSTMWGGIGFIR